MRIVERVFIVTTLAMVIFMWVSLKHQKAVLTTTNDQLADIKRLLKDSKISKELELASVAKIKNEVDSLKKENKTLVNSRNEKLKNEEINGEINQALIFIVETQALVNAGRQDSALSSLKRAKKVIWELGNKHAELKAGLHALMRPIDLSMKDIQKNPPVFSGHTQIYNELTAAMDN